MKILLFNRNEQYIATLRGVLSAKHTEELNGENILEIETLDEIEKNQRLIYKDRYGYWHEFIVKGVEEERTEAGIIRRVFAEHSFYETWGDYIEDKRPYDVPANIALSVALEPTRWEVGIIDDLGVNSTNFYHISAKEAVQKVAETWQGELRYRIEVSGNRITGRYVDLLARRGYDLGKRFTYTKDLISITKTVHRDDVITALYGYGKGQEIVDEEGQPTGGYGRRIDFADINNGKAYVENLEAKEIWGRLNPDGTRSHVFGKVEFDDVEDPHKLLELTKEKLKELSQPHITYEAKVIDLKALGIEHEGVELGDWVGIVDKEFKPPLRLKARVIKIVRDLLEPENTEITLGNFVPSITDAWLEQEKYISNFRDKQGVWDRSSIIGKDKTIDTQYLNGIIDVLKNKLLASRSGWYTDDRGNLIFENADKTAAMMLTGEGFMIASNKLPNGEYDWRTFGTGRGFIADYIVAGVLKGGKVHFDLTNGTLLIGENTENYKLYFDGSELRIKLSSNKLIETVLTDLETGLKDYADQKTQEAIDNIQVGGRNLILNSNYFPLNGSDYGNRNLTEIKIDENGEEYFSVVPINDGNIWNFGMKFSEPRYKDQVYTLSFDVMTEQDENWGLLFYTDRRRIITNIPSTKGKWVRYTYTFTQEETRNDNIVFGFTNLKAGKEIGWRRLKLEKGNKATDWTPAPEDVQEDIQNAEDNAKSYTDDIATRIEEKTAQLTASVDGITSEVSSIITEIGQVREYAESLVQQSADQLQVSITEQLDDLEDELVTRFQSEIQATADELTLKFTEYQESLSEIGADINNLKTTFRFSSHGLEIGQSDSPLKMLLSNEKLSFMDSGNEVAYVSSQKMFITEAEILNSIKVGNHVIEKYNDTITLVRWVG